MKYKSVTIEYDSGGSITIEDPIAVSIWSMEDVEMMVDDLSNIKTNSTRKEIFEHLRKRLDSYYLDAALDSCSSDGFREVLRSEIKQILGGDYIDH